MRRLIFAVFMMCLATPALTAEADLFQGSIYAMTWPASGLRLPDNRLAIDDSPVHPGWQYAQNLETGAPPEATTDGGTQPPAAPAGRSDSDGFQGGGTFDPFVAQSQSEAAARHVNTGHEPPDQLDLEQYNLMMKAWQKKR